MSEVDFKELVEKIIEKEFPDAVEEFSEKHKEFIIEYSIKKSSSEKGFLNKNHPEIKLVREYYKKYPKVEELLFNDAQNKVSLKDDIKKAVNVVIDAGLNILNNDAVCNNQGSRYYDCFEDYRKMFNKLKECIN